MGNFISQGKMVVLVASFLVGSLLFAGGNKEGTSSEQFPEVVWKFSHTQAPELLLNKTALMLSKEVSEKTQGKFDIQVFPSGTLGWEREVLESMQLGTIAMTWAANGPLGQFVPSYNIFSLPGLFKSVDHIKKVVTDKEIISALNKDAESKNLMVVGIGNYVFRDTFTKKNPINKPSDFVGTSIRVMGVPVLVDTYKALGANVTTTAWTELYSALQLGVVDGIDHVPSAVVSMKFYENLNYEAHIPIFASPMLMVASKPLYDKLPQRYKEIFAEAVDNAMEYYNAQRTVEKEENEAILVKQGMSVNTPDPAPFMDKVQAVRAKYVAKMDPWVADLVKKIEEME